MGTSGRPSFSKRQKEQARAEKQRTKEAKRQQRKVERANPKPEGSDIATPEAPPPGAGTDSSG